MSDEELRGIFAANLNNFLELNGYNQADLARHMGVSTTTSSKWCTGKTAPRLDKIQKICNWLGIEKDDLLSGKSRRMKRITSTKMRANSLNFCTKTRNTVFCLMRPGK